MVNQYPHTVLITTQTSDATVDGDGNPVEGASSSLSLKGRWEVAKGSSMVTTEGGIQVAYSGIIYLPLPSSLIPPGSEVAVSDGAVIARGTVKQVVKGQFNWRLWV